MKKQLNDMHQLTAFRKEGFRGLVYVLFVREPRATIAESEFVGLLPGFFKPKPGLKWHGKLAADLLIDLWGLDGVERLSHARVAEKYGLSAERIRQIEAHLLRKLRFPSAVEKYERRPFGQD